MTRKKKKRKDLPDIFVSLPEEFPTEWTNVFTGDVLKFHGGFSLGNIVEEFPVAALYAKGNGQSAL